MHPHITHTSIRACSSKLSSAIECAPAGSENDEDCRLGQISNLMIVFFDIYHDDTVIAIIVIVCFFDRVIGETCP
jgi:hypothetical protein